MRRLLSLSLMLLANIAILAHVVVPHHHHNGALVFAPEAVGMEASPPGHFHDDSRPHGADSGRCVVSETLVAAVSRVSSPDVPLLLFPVSVVGVAMAEPLLLGLPFVSKPYEPCCHVGRPCLPWGLRAPPVC